MEIAALIDRFGKKMLPFSGFCSPGAEILIVSIGCTPIEFFFPGGEVKEL